MKGQGALGRFHGGFEGPELQIGQALAEGWVFRSFEGGGENRGGFGDGIAGQGFLAAYVPGLRPIPYAKGMAKCIPAGSSLTFQIHYTPNGTAQDDVTRIGLWFADAKSVTREVKTVAATNLMFAIPPGAGNYQVDATSNRLPEGSQVLTFMPHMHLRGKAFFYEAVFPNGKRETLLDVPRYDFNWQTAYREVKPLSFPAGTRIHAIAHFDNSVNNPANPNPNVAVRWGSASENEMMDGWVEYVDAPAAEISTRIH